ncbi:hypothetical protein ABLU29_09720 [Lactococcus lactis]|uniref:hypothetical protein n=1 Tax=Lactococcus lactis TaxID=1358 RepID=UPI003878340E
MSELGKTAPNEIYLIVGDTDKDCNFNELAEVTWADKPIYEETAIKYIKSYQLTIPKSIADILDNVFNSFIELQNNANSLMIQTIYTHYEPETPFYKWFNKEDNSYNISIIYLAGKALGVDLVKVVEGE